MKYIIFNICIILTLSGIYAWKSNYRDKIPEQFELLSPTNPKQMHEFRIALKQRNIDIIEATLLDVSNPQSKNYVPTITELSVINESKGKWWTSDKILDLIAPSEESIQPVISWLKSYEVEQLDVSGRDFIKVVARIEVIESMFNTEMYDFRSKETGRIFARVYRRFNIPDRLMEVIDMVTGLTELVPKSKSNAKSSYSNTRRNAQQSDPLGAVFPALLRAMYDMPSEFPVHPNSSIGIVVFGTDQAFDPSDIQAFNSQLDENVNVSQLVGNFVNASPDIDTTLELQFVNGSMMTFDSESSVRSRTRSKYGGAMALNTTEWYWLQPGWLYEFATDIFTASEYPLVVSMSSGWPEDGQCAMTLNCPSDNITSSYDYVRRVNVEYIKLGLKGITILAASGDQGAPGMENYDCSQDTLSNMFPASSPWVTAVGATMLITDPGTKNLTVNFPPACNATHCARTKREGACTYPTATITSGGGFSNVSSMPGYQREHVRSYLDSGVQLPTGLFDPTKRAYPDVAVNGHNYIAIYSSIAILDGSEAVFAGVIALLNSVMLNNGRQPLGFINPLLYKMAADDPSTFTDITTGNNYCTEYCCSDIGYVATKGWDPVTGLGTPVFSRMQSYIQKVLINK